VFSSSLRFPPFDGSCRPTKCKIFMTEIVR
jgi:hypothetical protein